MYGVNVVASSLLRAGTDGNAARMESPSRLILLVGEIGETSDTGEIGETGLGTLPEEVDRLRFNPVPLSGSSARIGCIGGGLGGGVVGGGKGGGKFRPIAVHLQF